MPADDGGRDRAGPRRRSAPSSSTCARSSGAPQEVLLKKDVLDRQLINVDGARLVRSNEIELARLDGWYRVVGVDVGLRGLARRLLPRALAGASARATSSTGRASSRSPATCRPCGCACRIRSSRDCIRRSSPTSSRRRRTARARRSSRRSATIPSSRPTSSRSSRRDHQLEFLEDRSDEEIAERARADGGRRRRRPRRRAAGGAARAGRRAAAARSSAGACGRCSATTRRPRAG